MRFFRSRPPQIEPSLIDASSGNFHQEVVGESFNQGVLRKIADIEGGEFVALLIPDPANEYDKNAIRVEHPTLGQCGHLPADLAAEVSEALAMLWREGSVVSCHARLGGGGPGRSYGVWLDSDLTPYGGAPPAGQPRGLPDTIQRTPEDDRRRKRLNAFAANCQETPLAGFRIVITGELATWGRDECVRVLERLGARVSNSVSAKTTHVIVGLNPGAKLRSATERGTPTITEVEFIETILEPAHEAWTQRTRP